MKTKLQSMGFSLGHVQLIGVAVVIFAVLFFSQSNINLHAMFSKADQKTLTYDDVKTQVLADNGDAAADPSANAAADQQLALIDRSLDNGQVLGDAIGIGTVPDANQVFTRNQLDQIKVATVPTTKDTLEKYAEGVTGVEAQNDAITMLGSLNSNDPTVLKQTQQQADTIVKNLATLAVPSELADYQRYKMLYYKTLASMGQSFATNTLDTNFESTSKIFFSLTSKMEQIKNDIQAKYQVSL